MNRWAWPRRRPRPMSRQTAIAPALLAMIGVLAAAKIALLVQDAVQALSVPALHEMPVVAGRIASTPEMEPAAGPGENTPAAIAPEREAARPGVNARVTRATEREAGRPATSTEPARAPAGPTPPASRSIA